MLNRKLYNKKYYNEFMKGLDKNSKEYKKFRMGANKRNKKYYNLHKEKINKWHREYRKKNKDKISEYGYKLRARPEYQLRIRRWRKINKEHLRLKAKEWRQKNKERKNRLDREYNKRKWRDPILRQKEIERQTKFRKEHPRKVKSSKRKYNQSLKGRLTSTRYVHKRLAKIHGNGFDLTKEQIKEVWDRDKVCVYCSSDKKLELDHIIPLKKGGKTTFLNFVLACVNCNRTKSGRDVFEWCKLQGRKTPEIVLNNLNTMNYKL